MNRKLSTNKDINMLIIQKINQAMGFKDVNKSKMMEALNISRGHLYNILNGKVEISVVQLQQIASFLNLDLEYFLLDVETELTKVEESIHQYEKKVTNVHDNEHLKNIKNAFEFIFNELAT